MSRVKSGAACALVMSHDTYRNAVQDVIEVPWAMCVYDEVHRLKSDKSKAYEAAHLLHKKVFRVGLSDQLFTNCNASELWSVMNWIVPWRLGDRNLYDSYFVKPINDGHRNIHTDVAQQRTRELHAHLSAAMTPGIGEAQLFRQYVHQTSKAPTVPLRQPTKRSRRWRALRICRSPKWRPNYSRWTSAGATRCAVESSRANSARSPPFSSNGRKKTTTRSEHDD